MRGIRHPGWRPCLGHQTHAIRVAARAPRRPPRAGERGRPAHCRLRLARTIGAELALVVGGYVAYSAMRVLVAGDEGVAVRHGLAVLHTEERLRLAFEWDLQHAVMRAVPLVQVFNVLYLVLYLPFIIAAAVYLFIRDRERYARARTALLLSGVIGLLIFARFPVAPPRLLPGEGFADTMALYLHRFDRSHNSFANQFAAIPSFHVGWCALAAYSVGRTVRGRLVRGLLALVPVLMLGAVIVTGNHFWIDGAVAVVIVAITYQLAGLLARFVGQRRPAAGSG